ncbi:SDR family oxidoreductase [Chelatococcus sp. GCM10030263]|uniref:SDR family oxidoreductase n=1 Tax=Chelatococcus sp. GCM10030263 TaxID=3273387 RepID=UPI00361B390A
MTPNGNTILITGATSGIGRELAREFQNLGNKVIIAGRRKAVIDEATTANPGMSGYVLDIDDPAAIKEFAAKILVDHPDLNVLVNNAGIMKAEELTAETIDLAVAEATITTNLLGPIRLTAALLPHLRKQPRSAIVNVSSGLAFVPLVITPTYNATKAAIHSYTISLRRQLQGTTVEVLELIPPSVQTDLMPGHAEDPNAMPLADFMAETMAQFQLQPTPPEIKVERLKFLRDAEAEGRFEQTLDMLNSAH